MGNSDMRPQTWIPAPIRNLLRPIARPLFRLVWPLVSRAGRSLRRRAGKGLTAVRNIASRSYALLAGAKRAFWRGWANRPRSLKVLRDAGKDAAIVLLTTSGKLALRVSVPLGRRLTRWRAARGRMRSLWGVTPILTLPLLARADRMLGLQSHSLVFQTYYISSAFDINLSGLFKHVLSKNTLVYIGATYWILAWLILRYDVFHYFYDRGILLPPNMRLWIDPLELQHLKAADKRIYTYAYGADVRTRQTTLALGNYNFCRDCDAPGRYCICSEEEAERNVEGIRKYANAMVSMGDMIHYVPGCRNMHYWPIDIDNVRYVGCNWDGGRPLRLLHAPNHSHFKGTKYLLDAIERLRATGVQIDLKTISGVPNVEVLKCMAEADVIAEQFIGGAYGYTALEAWAMGKPVLTFVRDSSATPDLDAFPGINTNPDTLFETLTTMTDGRYDLTDIGRRSRRYVERHYALEAIAVSQGTMYLETGSPSPRWRAHLQAHVAIAAEARDRRLAQPLPEEFKSPPARAMQAPPSIAQPGRIA